MSLNLGLTGANQFFQNVLYLSTVFSPTWVIKAGYFYPRFNLQTDISAGKYLNDDYTFHIDIGRHFGETSIGFYAYRSITGMIIISALMSLYFTSGKRSRRHHFRVLPPRYYNFDYVADTG